VVVLPYFTLPSVLTISREKTSIRMSVLALSERLAVFQPRQFARTLVLRAQLLLISSSRVATLLEGSMLLREFMLT